MKQSYIADMVLSLKDKFAAVAWQGKPRKLAYLSRLGSRPSKTRPFALETPCGVNAMEGALTCQRDSRLATYITEWMTGLVVT